MSRVPARQALAASAPPRQLPLALGPLPQGLRPTPVLPAAPFDHPDWIFEGLCGGIRALLYLERGTARLLGASGRDITSAFPEVARAAPQAVRAEGVVLDGELVVRDRAGKPSLALTARRLLPVRGEAAPATFEVWDVLMRDYGFCLRLPLSKRKALLEQDLAPSEVVRLSGWQPQIGTAFFDAALSLGLAGALARHARSPYAPRRRDRRWLAFRGQLSSPLVVGGYTVGQGKRQPVERLLVGAYARGRLRYMGNIPSGLDGDVADLLQRRLVRLPAEHSPFVRAPKIGQLLCWCQPQAVVEVTCSGLDPKGHMRFARAIALRPDLAPRDCTLASLLPLSAPVREQG